MKKLAFLIIVFSNVCFAYAQSTVWYFPNNAGLKFNANGTTSPVTGVVMPATEGPSIITDADSNVLFYATPKNIYHGATNTLLYSSLLGTTSSTQGSIIIPLPGSYCNKFLVFTTEGCENTPSTPNGISVAFLSISGNYPSHTISISAPVSLFPGLRFSEKLAACFDGSGGYWLATHDYSTSNTSGGLNFYVFHIKNDATFSTISNSTQAKTALTNTSNYNAQAVGSPHRLNYQTQCYNAQGQLKFSKDRLKLGATIPGDMLAEIFDFNPVNGQLTFSHTLNEGGTGMTHGLEFSPNGNFVYLGEGFGNSTRYLSQWDLTQTTPTRIDISSYFISGGSYVFNDLQLGPNDKIYITGPNTGNTSLSVINNPDILGAGCNYAPLSASISGTSGGVLPVVISNQTSCSPPTCDTIAYSIAGPDTTCTGSTQSYYIISDTIVGYTWTVPAGWTIITGQGTDSITVTVGASAGTVSATAPSTLCNEVAQGLVVSLGGTPPLQPSPISGDNAPCFGTTQTYSVTNVSGVHYFWSVPSGWVIVSGQGTNSITVTAGSSFGNIVVTPWNDCNTGAMQTFAVSSMPFPAQPSVITGPTGVCDNTIQTYSVTSIAGVTYTWSVPSGWAIITGQGTNTITVTTSAGSGNVIVTPSNFCGDGTPSSLAVSILSIPTQPIVITGSSSPCAGTATTYSVPAVSGVNFTWTVPAGWVINSGQGTSSINVTPTSSIGTISVLAYNICDTATAQTLVVTPEALPSVSTHPANFSICAGGMATFDVTANGATSYQWQVNNGGGWVNITSAGTSPVYSGWTTSVLFINQTPFTANTWKYRCVVLNTCGAALSTFATLTVIPATITNVYDSLCKGEVYVLPGGGTTGNAGTFTDTLSSYQSCDSIVITHLLMNVVDISVTPSVGSLTANVSPALYQWLNCNTNTIVFGEISQTFTPTDSGHYAAIITKDGCTDTSACFQVIPLGVSNYSLNEGISIFPNPVNDFFTIHSDLGKSFSVIVYNSLGKEIFFRKEISQAMYTVNTGSYASGIYFLRITCDNSDRYFKISKQ